MNKQFVKVADPELANRLSSLGFQYIKEQNIFAFACTDELLSIIQKIATPSVFARENKLRF